MYRAGGKRILDLVLSASALVVLSPLVAMIGALVRIRLGSPVLFRQARPGLHGHAFTMYKFRTMMDARDQSGQPLPDADRLSTFGRLLRSTSLDELPELVNVIRGDMSLVGPRPLLMHYLERYTPEQMRRHESRPGITGLAQIGGRNALSWEERFALDIRYIDTVSLGRDLKIMTRTLIKTFRREGINQPGSATVEEYMGADFTS